MTVRAPAAKRDVTVDLLRGMAIVLVVLGHSIQYGSGNEFLLSGAYFDELLFKTIYSFHMPLFAMVSGYLLFWSMKRSAKDVILSRITSLVVPILVWTVGMECLDAGLLMVRGQTYAAMDQLLGMISLKFVVKLLETHWFLWAMFWCTMMVVLVEKGASGRRWIYAVLLLPMLFAPQTLNLDKFAYLYPFFVLGFLYHKRDKTPNVGIWATALCVLIFAGLLLFFERDSYIYISGISLLGGDPIRQLITDLYRWAIGLAGSLAVIRLVKLIPLVRSWWIRAIASLGRASMGIYILNAYAGANVIAKLTAGSSPNVLIWLAETAVFLAAAWAAVWVIRKIPLLRTLLLGGR